MDQGRLAARILYATHATILGRDCGGEGGCGSPHPFRLLFADRCCGDCIRFVVGAQIWRPTACSSTKGWWRARCCQRWSTRAKSAVAIESLSRRTEVFLSLLFSHICAYVSTGLFSFNLMIIWGGGRNNSLPVCARFHVYLRCQGKPTSGCDAVCGCSGRSAGGLTHHHHLCTHTPSNVAHQGLLHDCEGVPVDEQRIIFRGLQKKDVVQLREAGIAPYGCLGGRPPCRSPL